MITDPYFKNMTSYIHHPILGDLRVETDKLGKMDEVFLPTGHFLCSSIVEEFTDELEQLIFEHEPIEPEIGYDEQTDILRLTPVPNYPC